MYKRIMKKLLRMTSEQNVLDPQRFADPVASQTQWTPAKSGGANFRTHKLVEVNSYRMEFRASIGAKLFYLVFLLMGISVVIGFSYAKFSSSEFSFSVDSIIPVVVGLLFAIVGGTMFYFGTTPIVFDKTRGTFWRGRKIPDAVPGGQTPRHFAEFGQIHALQLISEYVRGDKNSYYSYELNLVLRNGDRINVIDHGNKSRLREDAGTLSTFLNKPIWDAI